MYLATLEQWERLYSVNARGAFLCYKYAGQQMVLQGQGGRIIGAASETAKRGNYSLYLLLSIL